jgi:hypothetical protein
MGITKKRRSGKLAVLCALILTGCLPGAGLDRQADSSSGERKPLVISGPGDETINLSVSQSLSWGKDDPLDIIVEGVWESYRWFIDGSKQEHAEGTARLTLPFLDLEQPVMGPHTVTVEVTSAAGDIYTKRVLFTVDI